MDNLITANVPSAQYVKFRLIQPFSTATQAASLGIFLKMIQTAAAENLGTLFPLSECFQKAK